MQILHQFFSGHYNIVYGIFGRVVDTWRYLEKFLDEMRNENAVFQVINENFSLRQSRIVRSEQRQMGAISATVNCWPIRSRNFFCFPAGKTTLLSLNDLAIPPF